MYDMTVPFLSTKSLLNRLPVNHLPDSLEILGLAILVLETILVSIASGKVRGKDKLVGMLPGIDSQERGELPDDSILIL